MKRLLIVDDEPAVGNFIGKVAEGCGYAVTCTTSATEFMDQVVLEEPAVIIMDLSMPGVDGVELLRFLATSKCKAKILIISGFDARVLETSGRLGSAMGLQIAGTINKPVRVSELRSAIANVEMGGML